MSFLRKVLFGFLMSALCATAIAASAVATDGVTTVTIDSEAPCVNTKVLALIPKLSAVLVQNGMEAVKPEDFNAAMVTDGGKQFGACYTMVGMGVIVIDDAGQDDSIFPVPLSDFRVTTPL